MTILVVFLYVVIQTRELAIKMINIVFGNFNSCIDSRAYTSDCIPDRALLDISLNSHGVKLFNTCKGESFRSVNGHIGNSDQNTFCQISDVQ